jgi:thymidine kinase
MDTRTNKELRGVIRLYIGPMFSCKTASLIEAYTRHSIGNRRCLLIKHSYDSRYDPKNIVSHDGRKILSSVVCDLLCDADHLVSDYNVVCIDEVQFFEDAPIFCDKWANQGLIIEASGLCGTYLRAEFPVISQLIPLAEEVYKKSAVCRETGEDANFTYRTSDDTEDIVVGGSDKYKPVDRVTYFGDLNSPKYKSYEENSFRKFMCIYCKKRNILVDDKMNQEIMTYFITYFSNQDVKNKCYVQILQSYLNKRKQNL